MTEEGLWVVDSLTDELVFIPYEDLDEDIRWQIFKPIGGFCYPMGQFAQLDLPQAPFWIQDWLPKMGKFLLYAPRKSGKSYLSYQMARCIGEGLPFLGMPTQQGRVLLLQFELGTAVLQQRIVKDTKKQYPNVFVGTSFSLKIDDSESKKLLWKAIEAVQPDVLILDPLYKIMSGDENETKDMKAIVEVLDQTISMFKCSIVIFHHAGKDISRGARGSSVIEDWVDTALEMKKTSKQGEPLRVKLTAKALRHAADPTDDMKLEMGEDYEFAPVAEVVTVSEQVLSFLQLARDTTGKPVSRGDILNAGIGSNSSVQDALNMLCEAGEVERVARGEYQTN